MNTLKNNLEGINKLQQGGQMKQWIKPAAVDNTKVVPTRMVPDHVQDNEIMRLLDKEPDNIAIKNAFKKQLMKYGNPSLEYGNNIVGTGRYSPFTNSVMVDNKFKGNLSLTKEVVLQELGHAKQFQDHPLNMLGRLFKDNIQRPFIDPYKSPGNFEYEAHSQLAPVIKQDYQNDIDANYIGARDEYDADDPESPYNKPKKLSKLDLLRQNNKKANSQ